MNIIKKYNAWKNAEHRAPISISNIIRVIKAYWRKYFPLIPKYITEQAKWRLTQVRPICKNQGSCTICGCDVEGLVYEDNSCEGNCYPKMMSKNIWASYKKLNFIKNN